MSETEIAEVRNQLRQEVGKEIQYIETSAKTGENVEWVFEELARDMIETETERLGEIKESLMFKVVLLGSPGIGSATLLHHLESGKFAESLKQTVGVQFMTKELDIEPPRMDLKPLRAEAKKSKEAMPTSSPTTLSPPAGPPASPPASPGGTPTTRQPATPTPVQPTTPAPVSTTSEDETSRRTKTRRTTGPPPTLLEDELDLEMPEEIDEDRMIPDAAFKEEELSEARIVRETAVSYYDRMSPQQNYPLRVKISKKQIILEPMDKISHVEGRLEVERDDQELPLVRVVPVFPGCIVTPQETTVNIDHEQTVFFYITPLALGQVDGRVEFWYRGQRVAFNETPTVVEKQTIAKIFAVIGTAVGVIPSALEFLGFNLNEIIKNQLAMNRPALKNFIDSIGGIVLAQVSVLAICLLLGGYFFYLKRPHQTAMQVTIAYS